MPAPAPARATPAPHASRPRLSVGFLLAENFTLSAFANFVDVLRLAGDEGDRSRRVLCDWAVLSDDMAQIRSSSGVRVQPDRRLRDAGRFDYIAVVGGVMGERHGLPPAARAFLDRQAAAGVPLIGLCTGVFLLYEAGLLEGYRACVNWFHHEDFLTRFRGAVPVSDQIFVTDRDRLTCSGGHSAAHLAAHLVARHLGPEAALKSLNIMIIDAALDAARPQPAPALPDPALPAQIEDPLVRKALIAMRQGIGAPRGVADLAARLGVSRRALERRFTRALGLTPARAALRLRLERAETLLAESEAPVAEIALDTGFCDAPHLIRAFRAGTGLTPAQFRARRAARAD